MPKTPDYTNKWHNKSFTYFDERRIELHQEVKEHPELLEYIQKYDQDEFEMILAEIAGYVGVILDDLYTEYDINHLCGVLTDKLKQKRKGIVIPR